MLKIICNYLFFHNWIRRNRDRRSFIIEEILMLTHSDFRDKANIRYIEYVVYLSFKPSFNYFASHPSYIKVQNHKVDKLMIQLLIPWKKFSPFEHQHTLKWQCRYIIRNFPHIKFTNSKLKADGYFSINVGNWT